MKIFKLIRPVHRLAAFLFVASLTVLLTLAASVAQAGNGTWLITAGNGAWLTSGNWASSVIPGSASTTGNTDWALFAVATQPAVSINMVTTAGNYYLGGIDYNISAARSINNNQTTAGVLTLNGATLNSVANTILCNRNSGGFTIKGNNNGNILGLALGNATDNIIQITSSGGVTISSVISGTGKQLTLQGGGSGVLTLAGANTYTGNTTVKSGTLLVNSSGSLASGSAVTVGGASASGTPKLGGSGTVGGTVSISAAGGGAAGHLAPGAGGSAATLNTGALTLGNTVNLDYILNTPDSAGGAGGNDFVNVTGNLTINPNVTLTISPGANIGAGKYHLIQYSGTLTDNSSSLSGWTMTGVSGETASFSIDSVNKYIDVTLGPVAVADTYSRAPSTGLKIYASDLVANDLVASGYTATYVSCDGTSVNGATLGTSGSGNSTIIIYPSSAGNTADSFTYTMNDGHGNTATGTVTITINNNVTGQATINLAGGSATVGFFGYPGDHYVVQRSVDSMSAWADLTTVTTANVTPGGTSVDGNGVITAPAGGAFSVTDPSPPMSPTSVFYQLRAAP